MSAPSSVLFICSHGDDRCPYLAALRAAGFSLRIAKITNAKLLLLWDGPATAIAIHQDDLQDGCNIAAELKNVAPQTPLILLRARGRSDQGKPFAVDAIYNADPTDAGLCRAAASFLRFNLNLRIDLKTD